MKYSFKYGVLFSFLLLSLMLRGQPSYIYEGGNGNGYSNIEINTNNNILFLGGNDDGYNNEIIIHNNNIFYKGGIDNGYISIFTYNSNKYIYNGGNSNGYTIDTTTDINHMLYKGGNDDGYSEFLAKTDFYWTGLIGAGWNVQGNWNYNMVPDINRKTIIPSNVPHYPHLNTGIFAIGDNPNNGIFKSGELWVQSGAWLITRVNNDIENYGNITIDGNMWVKNPDPYALTNFSQGEITIKPGGELTLSESDPFICGQDLTYDGQDYKTVLVGSQCWFAENINAGGMISTSTAQTNNSAIEKYCYNNVSANCDTYGGLYKWDEMMQYVTTESTQGICPSGWHLPSDDEYKELEQHLGMSAVDVNGNGWRGANEGSKSAYDASLWSGTVLETDPAFGTSGIDQLPAGLILSNSTSIYKNDRSYQWTSSGNTGSNVWVRHIKNSRTDINRIGLSKSYGFSARCVMD